MHNETLEAPEHLLSDYIEIGYLICVITLGVPLNTYILRRLVRQYPRSRKDVVKEGFLLLKIHLNISDLLLLVMAAGKLVWLCTYQWPGGVAACRTYQFMSMLSFYISSNIVVSIALDRLRNVLSANRLHGTNKTWNPVTVMVMASWLLALVFSWPQFFVFTVIDVMPSENGGWYQCTDIWQVTRAFGRPPNSAVPSWIFSEWLENAYAISHLVIVFWAPLLIMLASYVIIATRLIQYSQRSSPGVKYNAECSTTNVTRLVSIAPRSSFVETTNVRKYTTVSISSTRKYSWIDRCRSLAFLQRYNSNQEQTLPLAQHTDDEYRNPSLSTIQAEIRPCWRRQLRSKVFRSTLLLVVAHFFLWFPYNFMAIMKYIDESVYENMSNNANFFKDMQILIVLINPWIYHL